MSYATDQEVLVTLRRHVMAAMETGRHDLARTAIRELAEFNLNESRKLRADVIASYGINL